MMWLWWIVVAPLLVGLALLGVGWAVPKLYAWLNLWAGVVAIVVVALVAWMIRKPLPKGSLDDVSPVPQLAKVGATWALGAIVLAGGYLVAFGWR